jgi:hypothetical protein
MPHCGTCKYYGEPAPDERIGTCRFNPPTMNAQLVPQPQGPVIKGMQPQMVLKWQYMGGFPPVGHDMWCGSYSERERAANDS